VAHSSFSSVELLGSNTRNFSQVTFTCISCNICRGNWSICIVSLTGQMVLQSTTVVQDRSSPLCGKNL